MRWPKENAEHAGAREAGRDRDGSTRVRILAFKELCQIRRLSMAAAVQVFLYHAPLLLQQVINAISDVLHRRVLPCASCSQFCLRGLDWRARA